MDKLDGLRVFTAVVEAGSFTAGAAREGLSTALTSKYIARLEASFGARLLDRTTRKVRPTETGQDVYARAKRLLEDFEELTAAARDAHAAPRGALRVTAPQSFGELHLAGVVADFLEAYPEMSVDLHLSDRFVNLMDEGVDVAIRIGELETSSLIARRLSDAPLTLCASPRYLASSGALERPEDLAAHRCVIDTNRRPAERWGFVRDGAPFSVQVSGRFQVNSAIAVRDRLLRHQGVGLCPRYAVAPELASGALTALLPAFIPPPLAISAVYLESRHLSARIRSFIDFVAAALRV